MSGLFKEIFLSMYKKNHIFVATYILMGGIKTRRFVAAGIFYACSIIICGSEPPCDALMRSLPMRCKSTGKAEPSFYFGPNINFLKMTYTEKMKDFPISPVDVKTMHSENRPELIKSLYSRSLQQLINSFISELDAKNEAYYFIIENGHLDAFITYCKNERRANT